MGWENLLVDKFTMIKMSKFLLETNNIYKETTILAKRETYKKGSY